MLVNGVRDGIRLWDTHFHLLHNMNGVWFLDLHRIRLLNGIWDGLLDNLRNHFVHGHLNGMLNCDVDWIGLGNGDFHVIRDSNRDWMGNGHSNLLVNGHGNVLHLFRVRRMNFLVMSFIVGRIRRSNGEHAQ